MFSSNLLRRLSCVPTGPQEIADPKSARFLRDANTQPSWAGMEDLEGQESGSCTFGLPVDLEAGALAHRIDGNRDRNLGISMPMRPCLAA